MPPAFDLARLGEATCTVAPFAFSSSNGFKSSDSSKPCVAMMRILLFAMAGMVGSSKAGREDATRYMAGPLRCARKALYVNDQWRGAVKRETTRPAALEATRAMRL